VEGVVDVVIWGTGRTRGGGGGGRGGRRAEGRRNTTKGEGGGGGRWGGVGVIAKRKGRRTG